jgi:hypothetical protein
MGRALSAVVPAVPGAKIAWPRLVRAYATQDPSTFREQQVAALAAGEQDRTWDFVELF